MANINPVSKLRAKQKREYFRKRTAFLAVNPYCQAHRKIYPDMPTPRAVHVHHKNGCIGELLLDVSHYLGVCENCHHWIHSYPAKARAMGLLAELGDWNKTARTNHLRKET